MSRLLLHRLLGSFVDWSQSDYSSLTLPLDQDGVLVSQVKEEQSKHGYGNRDKTERKSGRARLVDARLEELRRRWENATDERENTEVSEQIRERRVQ